MRLPTIVAAGIARDGRTVPGYVEARSQWDDARIHGNDAVPRAASDRRHAAAAAQFAVYAVATIRSALSAI